MLQWQARRIASVEKGGSVSEEAGGGGGGFKVEV